MRAGLVPIINSWTGILIDDGIDGVSLSNVGDTIKEIKHKIVYYANIDNNFYKTLIKNNNAHANKFSQEGFTASYTKCIENVLDQ